MIRCRAPLVVLVPLLAALEGHAALEDPAAADGPLLATDLARPEPAKVPKRACSLVQPVCVHGARTVPGTSLLTALASLERAWRGLVQVLALPAPLPDGSLGGGPEIDLYVVDGPTSARTGHDLPLPWTLDRASAFVVVPSRMVASAAGAQDCVLEHVVATSVAEAIGLRIDAGEEPALRRAAAEQLADLVAPCADRDLVRLDDAQAHPERAPWPLLPGYLDVALSGTTSGILPVALATLASQKTPVGTMRWHNEPDSFDALRATLALRTPPTTVPDLLLDFSIARAFMGSRDDGHHLLGDGWTASFGRVRFEASIPFASLPRRVMGRAPLEPTGAAFVWIDVRSAPAGARVAMRAEWEPPTAFQWAAIRVRDDGSEASRVLVTSVQNATSAERNIEALDHLAGIAIVGVNVGDLALVHPFDPDELPLEPHGWSLTLATE